MVVQMTGRKIRSVFDRYNIAREIEILDAGQKLNEYLKTPFKDGISKDEENSQAVKVVPGDGIEPPTRGFSIRFAKTRKSIKCLIYKRIAFSPTLDIVG